MAHLCEQFEVNEADCEAAVLEFVNQIAQSGIVHVAPD